MELSDSSSSHQLKKDTPADLKIFTNFSSLSSQDSCHNDDLMDSFSLILKESQTSEKSDRELVPDQAAWQLRGISQTGSSGDCKDPGGM